MNEKQERIALGAIVALLLYGIIAEIINLKGHNLITVVNFQSVSLTIIQVEAVLFGLTISLVALLSGKMGESYLGINYADYLLNLKPRIFHQKRVIFVLLFMLVISLAFHMARLYNLVCSTFLCSCILIWLSTSNIYTAYSGKVKMDQKIQSYFEQQIQDENEKENNTRRKDLLANFLAEWKSCISEQENGIYLEYLHEFALLFDCMIKHDSERIALSDTCTALAKTMLVSPETYGRGIAFVYWCYERTASFVYRNHESIKGNRNPFYLLNAVYLELSNAAKQIPITLLEEQFRWDTFAENAAIVCCNLGPETTDGYNEGYIIECLGRVFGAIVANNPEKNEQVWGESLTKHYICYNKDSLHNEDCIRILANYRFNYIHSLIDGGESRLLTKFLFTDHYQFYKIDSDFAVLLLKVYCYLFYLAHYETATYAEQNLLDYAGKILDRRETKKSFRDLITYLEEHDVNIDTAYYADINVLNGNISQRMETELRHVEKIPRIGPAKLLVFDTVTRDFVIFLMTVLAKRADQPSVLKSVIPDNEASSYFIHYIREGNRKEQLSWFLALLDDPGENKPDLVEDLYLFLEKVIRERYKQAVLNEAEQIRSDESRNYNNLTESIEEYLHDKMKPILSDENIVCREICLFTVNLRTEILLKEILKDYFDYIACSILLAIYDQIKERGTKHNRNEAFEDDDHLLNYLRNRKETHIILGTEYVLKPKKYRLYEDFRDVLEHSDHSTWGSGDLVLLVRKGSIAITIKDIRIEESIETIEDSKAVFDKETGLYTYEPSVGMPIEMTEAELTSYLAKARRRYNIIASLGVVIKGDGILFEAFYRKEWKRSPDEKESRNTAAKGG